MESKDRVSSMGTVTGPLYDDTLICQYVKAVKPKRGAIQGENPFDYSLPVILFQISLIFLVSRFLYFLLKPLKQSLLAAQILAGIVLSRSFLGYFLPMEDLFPPEERVTLTIAAYIGIIFHLFLLMLQMNTSCIWSTGKSSVLIGITSTILPPVVGILVFVAVLRVTTVDEPTMIAIPPILLIHSLSSFPVVTSLLADLKILNSELGRFASKTSLISDLSCFVMYKISENFMKRTSPVAFKSLACIVAFIVAIIYIMRPLILWLTKHTKNGEPLAESHFFMIVVLVLISAFFSEVLGQHYAFGPLLLGMVLPDGTSLGLELEQKLNALCNGLLFPVFCAIGGLNTNSSFEKRLYTNISTVEDGKSNGVLFLMIIVSYTAKFMCTIVPAVCCGVQFGDAICLALIMCCKGIIEVSMYVRFKEEQIIDMHSYNLVLVTMLVLTGIFRPLIAHLYDPSKRYTTSNRRTLLNSNCNNELRVLVCIHNADNIPPIITLIKACNPTRYSSITVFVLHLMKLPGRSSAILAPHNQLDNFNAAGYCSTHSANAFNRLEQHFQGTVLVQHFTAVAPYKSMHADVCTVSLDERVDIVIVPFHKQWSVDGRMGSINPSVRLVNYGVMQKAPCSVAVLIDRGQIDHAQSRLTAPSFYRIGVLYFGGDDDWEALALGARMAMHPQVSLLIVQLKGPFYGNEKEKNFEDSVRYLTGSESQDRIRFAEYSVDNGEETTQVIRSLEEGLDLLMVGRHHDPRCSFMSGLEEWKECPELGLIGDMLSSSEFRFSVLVVIQQPINSGFAHNKILSLDSHSSNSLDSRVPFNSRIEEPSS